MSSKFRPLCKDNYAVIEFTDIAHSMGINASALSLYLACSTNVPTIYIPSLVMKYYMI